MTTICAIGYITHQPRETATTKTKTGEQNEKIKHVELAQNGMTEPGECCLALKLIHEGHDIPASVQAAIDLSSADDENYCEEYTES